MYGPSTGISVHAKYTRAAGSKCVYLITCVCVCVRERERGGGGANAGVQMINNNNKIIKKDNMD
jgi:hypothetical protein